MSLTALQIKHAKSGMHSDGYGLYLRVQDSGAKSWIFRFQLNRKRREMGIGTLTEKSGPDARAEASKLVALVRSGIDPIEERKRLETESLAQAKKREARSITFQDVANDYIESHRAGWKNAKHAEQWVTTIKTYTSTFIGNKPVEDITTDDVLQIIKPLWNTKTETASRLRSRIELILSYAKALKLRDGENPAIWRGHLDAILPAPSKLKNVRHHPALPYVQLPDFMKELRAATGYGARALEFAILTASRSGEARLATWSEIDLNNKLWTIPNDRMKGRREHWVPLSNQAIQLLKTLPKIDGNNYLFVGMKEKTAVSDMTMTAIIRRFNECEVGEPLKWIDPTSGDQIVPHGFRSTFRDWSADVGHYPRELALPPRALGRTKTHPNSNGKACSGRTTRPPFDTSSL